MPVPGLPGVGDTGTRHGLDDDFFHRLPCLLFTGLNVGDFPLGEHTFVFDNRAVVSPEIGIERLLNDGLAGDHFWRVLFGVNAMEQRLIFGGIRDRS